MVPKQVCSEETVFVESLSEGNGVVLECLQERKFLKSFGKFANQ
jgi:hypothetical protein